ncbi:MAG: hypothetical protein HGA87_00430 [Desulfobulbaceae bacterium]|nr:hypothetical protein [Desulfobulbaceae bacterium]
MSYICIAELGSHAPKFRHGTLAEAVEEAKNLHLRGLGDVMVAEVKAVITSREVPVVERRVVVDYEGGADDIPF